MSTGTSETKKEEGANQDLDNYSNYCASTASQSLATIQDDAEFYAEEELASNLVLADFSSPKNSYGSSMGFLDLSNLPTLSNTPNDDANEQIDSLFLTLHKTESMGDNQKTTFQKNLGPLMTKSICKHHKRQSFNSLRFLTSDKKQVKKTLNLKGNGIQSRKSSANLVAPFEYVVKRKPSHRIKLIS